MIPWASLLIGALSLVFVTGALYAAVRRWKGKRSTRSLSRLAIEGAERNEAHALKAATTAIENSEDRAARSVEEAVRNAADDARNDPSTFGDVLDSIRARGKRD